MNEVTHGNPLLYKLTAPLAMTLKRLYDPVSLEIVNK